MEKNKIMIIIPIIFVIGLIGTFGIASLMYTRETSILVGSEGYTMLILNDLGVEVLEIEGPTLWIGENQSVYFKLQNTYTSDIQINITIILNDGYSLSDPLGQYRFKIGLDPWVSKDFGTNVLIPIGVTSDIGIGLYNYAMPIGQGTCALTIVVTT